MHVSSLQSLVLRWLALKLTLQSLGGDGFNSSGLAMSQCLRRCLGFVGIVIRISSRCIGLSSVNLRYYVLSLTV